jgi:hypothetical protein
MNDNSYFTQTFQFEKFDSSIFNKIIIEYAFLKIVEEKK